MKGPYTKLFIAILSVTAGLKTTKCLQEKTTWNSIWCNYIMEYYAPMKKEQSIYNGVIWRALVTTTKKMQDAKCS